jgi:hypothetical protein
MDGRAKRVSGFKKSTPYEIKKANRLKKKRYYERHGIKFDKTVRNRDAAASKAGVPYDGRPLLYENYKEPLKQIEKAKGYGYYGTVAMTADKELVQCHICGHLYPNVGLHIRKHKISAERYKEVYKLAAQTALISEPVRRMYQEKVVAKLANKGKLPPWLKEYNEKVQRGEVKHPGSKRKEGGMSLEKRNELGMCPDQVLEKIKDLADKLGKPPSSTEFIEEYHYRFYHSITFQHGSWEKAVKKACGMTRDELRHPDKERLLQELLDFHEANKRIPMTSDFNRGMLRDRGVYIRTFGSLNNARIEAGLNAVLPLPFGQKIELTPEQYAEYKAGHPVVSEASNKRRKKRQAKRLQKGMIYADI